MQLWSILLPLLLSTPAAPPVWEPARSEAPTSREELVAFEKCLGECRSKTLPATVGIMYDTGPGGRFTGGSGVIVNKEGIVLTAAHVVSDMKPNSNLRLIFADGSVQPAERLGLNILHDVGMLRITAKAPKEGWPHAELGTTKNLKRGTWLYNLGHPGGAKPNRPPLLRLARFEGIEKNLSLIPISLVSHSFLRDGDSGGPLFDLEGHVVGITSQMPTNDPEHAIAIPMETVREYWKELLDGKILDQNTPRPAPTNPGTKLYGDNHGRTAMKDIFRPIGKDFNWSIVRVRAGGKTVALGTVIAKGWIATKASELPANASVECVTREGCLIPVHEKRIDRKTDLAFLKVDTKELKPISFADTEPAPGTVVSPLGAGGKVSSIGVVVGPNRELTGPEGVIVGRALFGVVPGEATKTGLPLTQVVPGSPAAESGLKVGDQLVMIGKQKVSNIDELFAAIESVGPNQKTTITFLRKGEEQKTETKFVVRPEEPLDPADGPLSRRRTGFPKVLVHDGLLSPRECGGPLVDSRGAMVGLNIARVSRVESWSLPAEVVKESLRTVTKEKP